ncbi:MAG: MFS transporter [Planctomycetota bacterium]|nr:MFS transporter [Planctomycetota bacterium]
MKHRRRGERPGGVRYLVLAWLCLAAMIAYVARQSLGVAESTVRRDLGLTEEQMGSIMAAFFLTYALAQVPSGWLVHRWGTRRLLPWLAVAWSAATAAVGLAPGAGALLAARWTSGLAQAGLFPASTSTVARWFSARERAIANGALACFMSLGGAGGVALTGILLGFMCWRLVFLPYGIAGCLWALGFALWFRDRPESHRAVGDAELRHIRGGDAERPAEAPPSSPPATPWLAIASSPAVWWICGQQFFRAAGNIFFATWYATYLQQAHGVSVKESGLFTTLPILAVAVGSLLGGAVSDAVLARTGSRRLARQGVATASLVACGSLVFLASLASGVTLEVLIVTAGMFCFALGSPCAYTITIDMGGSHVATVFSVMNMSGNIGAMLFPYVVPRFKALTGSWESVLFLFGSMFLAAAFCWSRLRPEGTVFDQALLGKRKAAS